MKIRLKEYIEEHRKELEANPIIHNKLELHCNYILMLDLIIILVISSVLTLK